MKEEISQNLIQLQEERASTSKLNKQIGELELQITELQAKQGSSDILKDEAISLVVTLRYIQEEFNLKLDDLQQNYATFSKLSKKLFDKVQENDKVIESFNKFKSWEMTSTMVPLVAEIIYEDEKLKIQVELDVIYASCNHSLELKNNTVEFCVNLWNGASDIVIDNQMPMIQQLDDSSHSQCNYAKLYLMLIYVNVDIFFVNLYFYR